MTRERTVLLIGAGYVARRLARRLLAEGWRVFGTGREEAALQALEAAGITPFFFDGARPLPDAAWEGVTHALSSVPPDAAGDPVLRTLAESFRSRARQFRWIGYLSTVGVYGDHGGAWVDEETPPSPVSERGKRRLAAERAWLALWRQHALPVHVFRLPGIYGPGRSPLDKARQGVRRVLVVKEGQVFSRIHVDDLVAALKLSMETPTPGEIFNVTDDHPAPPHDVALHAHALLGIRPPPSQPFEAVEEALSPMARSFYGESKRVSNAKLKARLGWRPAYPDYKAGLAAILEEERRRDGRRRETPS